MNEGIVFNPAGDVSVDVAFSAALAGYVAIGVTSSMDLAGNVTIMMFSVLYVQLMCGACAMGQFSHGL